MVTAPEKEQIVVARPFDSSRPVHQLIEVATEALETLMLQWEIEKLGVAISFYYQEVVCQGELPTNDFIDAVKRDFETHGKIVVTLLPAPEGYNSRSDFQMMAVGAVRWGNRFKVAAILFSADLLRRTQELAHAAEAEDGT